MPTSCKSNKENKLTPEDLVGILQKKYRNSGNLPDYDEVTPELLSRIEKLRPQIDKALTKLQSYTFGGFVKTESEKDQSYVNSLILSFY